MHSARGPRMKTNSNPVAEIEDEQSAAMNAWPLFAVLRRGMWLIAACACAGLVLAAVYAAIRADVFEVTATVQVEQETPSVISVQDAGKNDIPQPDEDLKTVEQQLLARNLIWRVIQMNKRCYRLEVLTLANFRCLLNTNFNTSEGD